MRPQLLTNMEILLKSYGCFTALNIKGYSSDRLLFLNSPHSCYEAALHRCPGVVWCNPRITDGGEAALIKDKAENMTIRMDKPKR